MPHDAAFANDIIVHEFMHAIVDKVIGYFFGTEAAGLEEGMNFRSPVIIMQFIVLM